MASNVYTRITADGIARTYQRKGTQGRKPKGLSKPFLVRVYADDEKRMNEISEKLGAYWNKNDFVREAVRIHAQNIYTELVKP